MGQSLIKINFSVVREQKIVLTKFDSQISNLYVAYTSKFGIWSFQTRWLIDKICAWIRLWFAVWFSALDFNKSLCKLCHTPYWPFKKTNIQNIPNSASIYQRRSSVARTAYCIPLYAFSRWPCGRFLISFFAKCWNKSNFICRRVLKSWTEF